VFVCCVQVSLLLDQADQYDEAANAALKGIRAEPQQPELPRLRQALGSVQKVLLLAESQDVSGKHRHWTYLFVLCSSSWERGARVCDAAAASYKLQALDLLVGETIK
jgi:hypothetical protein